MNEYDSDRLSESLQAAGYIKSEDEDSYDSMDLVILNTCSIREKATDKIYSELGRIRIAKEKLKKNGTYMIIAVIGCVPETEGEKIFRRAPYVDIIAGPQSYNKLRDMINNIKDNIILDPKHKIPVVSEKAKHLKHLELSTTDKFDFLNEERQIANNISAYISIQEGCNKFCTYCVVPNTRGREVSRPVDDILKEVIKVSDLGVKEVVLLGQNVNAYQLEKDGKTWKLSTLIEEIAKIEKIERIRYTTSHPRDMSDDLIEAHATCKKLIPYLHLPVQSGSDEILKKMNRKYTNQEYIDIISKIRAKRPDIVFSSDFIVGFPGETEQDFEDTLSLIKKVQFQAQSFSYKYSKRPKTVANMMSDQLSEDTKTERLHRLQSLLEEQRAGFNKSTNGKIVEVLFDKKFISEGEFNINGRSEFMQSITVKCKNTEEVNNLFGKIKKVKIIAFPFAELV